MPLSKAQVEALKHNPLEIDSLLGKPKNRVARIGVELEGAWKSLPPGTRLEPDGSVFKDPLTETKKVPAGHQAGELPIGPIQPAALPKFMKKYYPHKTDKTCGMHVHMSFESVWHYALLMVPEYQDTIIEYLDRWARAEGFPSTHFIYERLAGKSVYCQKKFWADAQVQYTKKDHDQHRHGHRYTIIHYCGRQMTVEVRVLPMMDTVEQAIRGVRQVVDITNACLVVLGRKKEQQERMHLEIAQNESYEEYIEEGL